MSETDTARLGRIRQRAQARQPQRAGLGLGTHVSQMSDWDRERIERNRARWRDPAFRVAEWVGWYTMRRLELLRSPWLRAAPRDTAARGAMQP